MKILMDKLHRTRGSQQTIYTCPNIITYIYTQRHNKIHKKTSKSIYATTSDNSVTDKKLEVLEN